MSQQTNGITDPFKTSGSSPPLADATVVAEKKSQAEIRAEEEFKSACKLMAEARQRRDTLKKRRQERELKEQLDALVFENAALRTRVEGYQRAQDELYSVIRQLESDAQAAWSEREKLIEKQKEIALDMAKKLKERDSIIEGFRLALDVISYAANEISEVAETAGDCALADPQPQAHH